MIFKKNVTRPQRIVRVLGGAVMVACGLFGLHAGSLRWGIAMVGVVSIVTGLVRYCPACSLAGRPPCGD